jgi:hypothetical protein
MRRKNKMEENKQNIDSPHSVKWSMNAKGQVSAEVKCYGTTPEEALERASKLLISVEAVIKEKNGA